MLVGVASRSANRRFPYAYSSDRMFVIVGAPDSARLSNIKVKIERSEDNELIIVVKKTQGEKENNDTVRDTVARLFN